MNGFRSGAAQGLRDGAYRERVATVAAIAKCDPQDERANAAVSEAMVQGRLVFGFHLKEPPWNQPEGALLTEAEYAEADTLLKGWLFDALDELGS